MSGKKLMIAILAFTAVFAAGLWYAQNYAFYDEISAEAVVIDGVSYPVEGFVGIDATTSPLKLRACFTLPEEPSAPAFGKALPLVAPGWFDCFDTGAITAALAEGRAVAYLAAAEERPGADRVVVRYPDGTAFMWRQLTAEFQEQ